MSAHTHREFVNGCYRCDLSRDEVSANAWYRDGVRCCSACGRPAYLPDGTFDERHDNC